MKEQYNIRIAMRDLKLVIADCENHGLNQEARVLKGVLNNIRKSSTSAKRRFAQSDLSMFDDIDTMSNHNDGMHDHHIYDDKLKLDDDELQLENDELDDEIFDDEYELEGDSDDGLPFGHMSNQYSDTSDSGINFNNDLIDTTKIFNDSPGMDYKNMEPKLFKNTLNDLTKHNNKFDHSLHSNLNDGSLDYDNLDLNAMMEE